MNKLELLAVLEAAGVEGYSMADPKADLEDAVALLEPAPEVETAEAHEPPEGWTGHDHKHPRVCWCGRLKGHPIV